MKIGGARNSVKIKLEWVKCIVHAVAGGLNTALAGAMVQKNR